jgi:hypothetical protein
MANHSRAVNHNVLRRFWRCHLDRGCCYEIQEAGKGIACINGQVALIFLDHFYDVFWENY